MHQVHLFISGFVQGVGYRNHVQYNAKKLGLKGWTRNLNDRRVEVVAQGDRGILEKLIKMCEKGSLLAEVKDISVEWETPKEKFEGFERKPTL